MGMVVPISPGAKPNAPAQAQPSQTDLLMALSEMQKQGRFDQPSLSDEEWKNWQDLPIKDGNTFYKDQPGVVDAARKDPTGVVVDKKHPELKSVPKDLELMKIPGSTGEGNYLLRPKAQEALTS